MKAYPIGYLGLSDKWLKRFKLVKNSHRSINYYGSVTETETVMDLRITWITAIALLEQLQRKPAFCIS